MANNTGPELPSQGPIVDLDGLPTGAPVSREVENVVPDGLSVADTVEWVGTDKARAQAALDAEGSDGRRTLVEQLHRVLDEETGAGIASGEA
jgi:hypothetical protein